MKTRELAVRSIPPTSALWVSVLLLVSAMSVCLLPRLTHAQDVNYEIFTDSEITLNEISEEGFYYSRTISMVCVEGKVRINQVIDEEEFGADLPYDSYNSLWQQAIGAGLPGIGDAPTENAFPGQSDFDYLYRDGEISHNFSAYAVDYLTDRRYRELARNIIALADLTFSDEPPPPPPQ